MLKKTAMTRILFYPINENVMMRTSCDWINEIEGGSYSNK